MFFYSIFRNSSLQKHPLYLSLWPFYFLNFPLFFHCDYLTSNYIFISSICWVYLIVLLFPLIGLCFLFPLILQCLFCSYNYFELVQSYAFIRIIYGTTYLHGICSCSLTNFLLFWIDYVFCMFFFCYFHRHNSIVAVVSVYIHFTWWALVRVFNIQLVLEQQRFELHVST